MSIADAFIVGAGPAGVAAAVQCKRLGLSVLLMDKTGAAGGLTAAANRIENYPGLPPMSGGAFVHLLNDHLTRFDIPVVEGVVTSISPRSGGFDVATTSETFRARIVVIAVGTEPKTVDIPGREHVLHSPLEVPCQPGFHTAVIGGGEAALDFALSLADMGGGATVLVRGGALRAHGILPERVRKNEKVHILFGADPGEITPDEAGLSVAFRDASIPPVHAQFVLAAVGRRPASPELFRGLDLTSTEGVSSTVSGIYVVGDARFGTLGQIGIAVGDGLSAAMSARVFISALR